MPRPWENNSGYHDPTAYEGMKAVNREDAEQQKRVNSLIYVVKFIVNAAGFDLINRIEIRDRKTMREYR